MQVLWQLYVICFRAGRRTFRNGVSDQPDVAGTLVRTPPGLAIGLVNSAGGLSGSAAPLALTFLISSFVGAPQ